jgi:2-polyprenyl-6-hydroxyphenyl methylase/3-demethylubiquinone-9 3-methyltransferase
MQNYSEADRNEIAKFDSIAPEWWNPSGEMGTLHTINPLRLKFIAENLNLPSCRILDVGCGGGILSEALAKEGAQVTGLDLSLLSLKIARQHAEAQGLNIDYRYESLEDFSKEHSGDFDAVVCMEMLEHTPRPDRLVALCTQVLRPGGHFFCSTINRTPKSFLFAIIAGEYFLHLLPRGSHSYKNLIRPNELKNWAQKNKFKFVRLSSLMYNPLTRKFKIIEGKEDIDYLAHFIKE